MSEFGQQYRIYNASDENVRDLLAGLNGWSVAELKVYDRLESVFHQTNTAPEPTDIFRVAPVETHQYTTLDLWNLDMHEGIIEALNKQKRTYLTYLFHTGAGFDELNVYVEGKLSLTEDLGECYQFTTNDACAELELDYDRNDAQGRTFVIADPPIRETELQTLADQMGPSAAILHGWEDCVKQELPLHYLPGLD